MGKLQLKKTHAVKEEDLLSPLTNPRDTVWEYAFYRENPTVLVYDGRFLEDVSKELNLYKFNINNPRDALVAAFSLKE